jgi:nucleoside-diphosphate-sugar epimerase
MVCGGAGFIGSNLCERLLTEGHEVICVDNLITGSEANIEPLKTQPGFRFLRHDIIEPMNEKVEVIFHLASPASPPGYLNYPVETSLANSLGTYHLLELAKRNNAKFLIASTSEIYGEPLEHPQRETYWGNVNPVGMRSCYDESKRMGESLTMTYRRHFDLDSRIIRIFNTYGPHSDPNDGRIVPNFITQALYNKPITVYGEGNQTRSLCYVDDLVEGIIRAMFTPNSKGNITNLGNPDEHTVLEYAQVIRRLCGSQSEIVHVAPISEDDPSRRKPDISRAKQLLGWEPKIGLEEGLGKTVAWFRQKLNLPTEG